VTAVLVPDAEVVAVAWARQDPDIARVLLELAPQGASPGGVSTSMPKVPTFPHVIVNGIRSDPVGEAIPMGMEWIQWDVYGARLRSGGIGADWATASLVARTIEAKARDTEDVAVDVTGGAFIRSMTVITRPRPMADPNGLARYQLQTLMAMHA
jgi:hypothetical protein